MNKRRHIRTKKSGEGVKTAKKSKYINILNLLDPGTIPGGNKADIK